MTDGPDDLTPAAVAALLRIREGTLRNWRSSGYGPPYLKLGAGVVYRRADVLGWMEAQRVVPAGRIKKIDGPVTTEALDTTGADYVVEGDQIRRVPAGRGSK
jgi:hypothetical protein